MTCEINSLAERQPHVAVSCTDGVHVLPVSLLRDVIAGRVEASILTEPVLRRVVQEWLLFTQAGQG
ncbi:hypothetical protein AO738_04005 [Pseudomonas citronellolis]|nr:hypothetical protein AO742_18425 [Pseudomonas citronellolis]KRW77701.1 hypothetical protein AO738_04005 [Pseudomonas citronellolis]